MMEQVINEEEGENRLTKAERKLQRREERTKERESQEKQQKTKKIITWTLVLVGLILVVWAVTRSSQKGEENKSFSAAGLDVLDTDWVKGNREASVVLIEYADFQCPACKKYSSVVERLAEEYGDRIAIVYRHFPLKQIHSNAESAAIAAEAAGQQGKFWEMHDLLFERQSEWSESRDIDAVIADYALELGVDGDIFNKDLKSDSISEKVDNHYKGAVSLRVNSTPTFFLNGQKLESVRSYEQFREAIEEALNSGP